MENIKIECTEDAVDALLVKDDHDGCVAIRPSPIGPLVCVSPQDAMRLRDWLSGWLRQWGHEKPSADEGPPVDCTPPAYHHPSYTEGRADALASVVDKLIASRVVTADTKSQLGRELSTLVNDAERFGKP